MEEKDPKPAEDVAGDTGSVAERDLDAGASENLPPEQERSHQADDHRMVEVEGPVEDGPRED